MNPETTTELATVEPPEDLQERAADKVISPFTVDTLLERVNLVKEAMRRCMEEGKHFGTVPGTKKPSLWKPGAELLGVLFQLGQRYQVQERILAGDHILYTVTCTLFFRPAGSDISEGVGACNSMEYKYRVQTEARTYKDGNPSPPKYTPHEFYNTCLKMACKRALIAATINASGVSEIFTQDTEDNPDLYRERDQPAASKPQNGNGNHAAPPEPVTLKGVVSGYEAKPSAGKLFHGVLVGEARVVTTELGHTLKQLVGLEVAVLAVPSKKSGVFHLRSIQSVTSPNGAAKRPAAKPDDEATPEGRTAWEEVQRQLVESDINEHWVVKAAQRLQFIPAGVQRLADLSEKQIKVLLVRFSDLVTAARQEEQGIVEEAAA
jgi:hypothetical protein